MLGNRRGRLRPVGRDAIELEPVRHAAVQAVLEVGDRLVVQAERPPRDIELQVELAQQEVVRRHVADERDQHAAPPLFARQHQRQRRFALAPDAAEQIDLPRELEAVGRRSDASCRRRSIGVCRVRRLPHAVARRRRRPADTGTTWRCPPGRAPPRRAPPPPADRGCCAIASRISACSVGIVEDLEPRRVGQRLGLRGSSTNRYCGGAGISGRA